MQDHKKQNTKYKWQIYKIQIGTTTNWDLQKEYHTISNTMTAVM